MIVPALHVYCCDSNQHYTLRVPLCLSRKNADRAPNKWISNVGNSLVAYGLLRISTCVPCYGSGL
ncbi:hypothetical protein T01_7583, partial [Trichinella spiralis]